MEKPDVIAIHFLTSSALVVCANIGLANTNSASKIKTVFLFIVKLTPSMKSPQGVVPVILLQPGSH
jgi:hypothetical protein